MEFSQKQIKLKPTVINNGTIMKNLEEDDHQLDSVQIVRLDFLNIIKIENLWMLKSLKKLSLTHNKIEIIENLEELVNLKELDLSFNQISKIENIHTLINIEILMLNNNKIDKLQNMENLEILRVFSISGNSIADYKEFTYLRKLDSLRSLSFKNNPCCDDSQCDSFIKAILPKVVYINYVMVTADEREKFRNQFDYVIRKLDEEEELGEREILIQRKIEYENEINYQSFVEYLNDYELFETMFEHDKILYDCLNISIHTFEEFDDYKLFYGHIMKEFVDFGHNKYYQRDIEIKLFKDVIKTARNNCADRNKNLVKIFSSERRDVLKSMLKLTMNVKEKNLSNINTEITKLCNALKTTISNLWKNLMMEEITLNEQCEVTKNHFVRNIEEFSYNITNMGQLVFNKWREKEMEWQIKFEKWIKDSIDTETYTDNICESILNKISTNHMQFINDREELLLARVQKWSNELIQEVTWEEIQRNRKRILEIMYLIQKYKSHLEEINKLIINNELYSNFEKCLLLIE